MCLYAYGHWLGLWELCSKFSALFYSEFLFIMLNFSILFFYAASSIAFYAASSIAIPYLQFELPIKLSYFTYTLVKPLIKKYPFHFY